MVVTHACQTGKRQFHDRAEAKAALTRIKSNEDTRGKGVKPCRAYKCPFCKRWHLTSQEEK